LIAIFHSLESNIVPLQTLELYDPLFLGNGSNGSDADDTLILSISEVAAK
jgi:hypothetical protein